MSLKTIDGPETWKTKKIIKTYALWGLQLIRYVTMKPDAQRRKKKEKTPDAKLRKLCIQESSEIDAIGRAVSFWIWKQNDTKNIISNEQRFKLDFKIGNDDERR